MKLVINGPEEKRIADNKKKLEHYYANKERYAERAKNWKQQNKAHYNEYMRNWNKENTDYTSPQVRKNRANYRARLQKATPKWVEIDKVNEIYSLAKKLELELNIKLHVDHVEALNGDQYSGLHTWWNLQILPAKVNQSKSNKNKNIILPRVSDNFNEYLKEVENICRTYTNVEV